MFFSSVNSEKKGREVRSNLFFFSENQMLDCNQYIIKDPATDELILFDAGNGISLKGLFKGMEKLNLNPSNIRKVFLTHEHVDHVLGLYPLVKLNKNNPLEVFAYGETAKILTEGDENRIFPGNLGIKPSMFGVEIIPLEIIDLINTKEIKISSEYNFQIHYTPGHSLGSISFYDSNNKVLIPGDLVFIGGSFGRYDFPGGSLTKLINSIKYVNNLDVNYLLPGHMGISDQGNQQIAFSYKMVQSISFF
ncbi:MAG: MBL fold metallo-hydrolase [Candidatus Hodarchaeota archaeon]